MELNEDDEDSVDAFEKYLASQMNKLESAKKALVINTTTHCNVITLDIILYMHA